MVSISSNSGSVRPVASSRKVSFKPLPPSAAAAQKLAVPPIIKSAAQLQSNTAQMAQQRRPVVFNPESSTPWFDRAQYSVKAARERLADLRKEGLADFVGNTERAKPKDCDAANQRLGQFLAAKCALVGRLPDGTELGRPMQVAELNNAVLAAMPEVERITLKKSPSADSLLRGAIMGLKQKTGALAHSLDRARRVPDGGVDADGNRIFDPKTVHFDGHAFDLSDTRTAAILMLAAMPLDTLAEAPRSPESGRASLRPGWVVHARCNITQQTVVLDKAALWAISNSVEEAEKFSDLSLRFQPPEKAPLDEYYTRQVALHQDTLWVKTAQNTADLLMAAPSSMIEKGKSAFAKVAKSLWFSMLTKSSPNAPSAIDSKPVAPAVVDMTSRSSRRHAVERLMSSIDPNSPTADCLDQLLELKQVLNGFDQNGKKVAKDLSVFYADGWFATFNIKGYADKSALVDAAEELLEKHKENLIKIATYSSGNGSSGFSVQNRAKAALVAFPKELWCGSRLGSFGFRDQKGLIDSAQQIAQLAQAPVGAHLHFDSSLGFSRLSRCFIGGPMSDPNDPFDTLVLLDAVVDYRNSETGENRGKDYRLYPRNYQPVVDLSSSTVSTTQQVENFKESFKKRVEDVLLTPRGAEQSRMIGEAIQTLISQAKDRKMSPEALFNEFEFDKPLKPGEPGPSVLPKLSFYDFMALAQPDESSDADSVRSSA